MLQDKRAWLIAAVALFSPYIASAHEVYVLTSQEISSGLATPPFSEWQILMGDLHQFIFWAFVGALTVFIVLCISLIRPLEHALQPLFLRLRHYAPFIARATVGIAFIAAAYYGASYGPELPLGGIYGSYALAARLLLGAIGIMMLLGYSVRFAALLALVFFAVATYVHGSYMLTYTNYLGEIVTLLLLGAHKASADGHAPLSKHSPNLLERIGAWFAPYSFCILRVCFGISLLYAALYAKFFHNYLALQVASLPLAGHTYGMAHYLGFEPHFLVLGAGIIEVVIAIFFILGIEIRFTSIFLEFWLALSLIYFGEVVWPHLILIGIPLAFICYGYDDYSLEGWLTKKVSLDPVL